MQAEDENLEPVGAMRFPLKLWKIVNECDSGAVGWNSDGSGILLDYAKFRTEYLAQSSNQDVFKTSNIKSFIRQLNLYKFRKSGVHSTTVHEFRNDFFLRGRSDLLSYIIRRGRAPLVELGKKPRRNATTSMVNNIETLKRCQKRLTKALERAVIRKERMKKSSYYFHEDCLRLVLDEGPEFPLHDDTELLRNEFHSNWGNQEEYELEAYHGQQENLQLGYCLPFATVDSQEIEIANTVPGGWEDDAWPGHCTAMWGPAEAVWPDCQTTFDDVKWRMDTAFAENTYNMLLNLNRQHGVEMTGGQQEVEPSPTDQSQYDQQQQWLDNSYLLTMME